MDAAKERLARKAIHRSDKRDNEYSSLRRREEQARLNVIRGANSGSKLYGELPSIQ